MISAAITLPIIGSLLLLAIPNRDGSKDSLVRWVALGASLVTFAVTLVLWAGYDPANPAFQFVERAPWIPQFGIDYYVGIDGLLEGLCPPYVTDMDAAVDQLIEEKLRELVPVAAQVFVPPGTEDPSDFVSYDIHSAEIYGFAYWLVRYSGYTVEPPDAPDGLRHKLREARKRCRELAQAIFESFPHAHTPKIRALLRKWDDDGLG